MARAASAPGLERLRDPLTGHRVDDVGGVADEQRAPVREPPAVVAGGNGPGAHRALGLGVGPEGAAQMRSVGERAPLRGERLTARGVGVPVPEDAEADVGAAVADGEHPRVAGEEVLFEQDPEAAVVDAGEVLAERVPARSTSRRSTSGSEVGAVVARAAEQLAGGGVVPVGGHDPPRRYDAAVSECRAVLVPVLLERGHRRVLAELDTVRPGVLDERGIELDARHDARVRAVDGKGHDHFAPGR